MASYVEGIWSEKAKVSIQAFSTGYNLRFGAMTSDISITEGDKEFDQIVTLSGARLVKFNPQGPIEITMTMFPIDVVTGGKADKSFSWAIHPFFDDTSSNWDSSVLNTTSKISTNREKFRVALLWTNDGANTDAYSTTATGTFGIRYVLANAYLVSCNTDFTGDGLKVTAKFKATPFDSIGSPNRVIQSCNLASSTGMTTLCATYGTALGESGKFW